MRSAIRALRHDRGTAVSVRTQARPTPGARHWPNAPRTCLPWRAHFLRGRYGRPSMAGLGVCVYECVHRVTPLNSRPCRVPCSPGSTCGRDRPPRRPRRNRDQPTPGNRATHGATTNGHAVESVTSDLWRRIWTSHPRIPCDRRCRACSGMHARRCDQDDGDGVRCNRRSTA